MADSLLLSRAASCYRRLGLMEEAARCYREAGSFRASADLFVALGRYRDGAADYAAGGMSELAGWILAHFAGDPAAARTHLAVPAPGPGRTAAARRLRPVGSDPAGTDPVAADLAGADLAGAESAGDPAPQSPSRQPRLRRRLVLARCDVAEGAAAHVPLPVFKAVQQEFARPNVPHDIVVEQWTIALAEVLGRHDQIALTFAAAVRGRKPGAADRWAQWSAQVLRTELTLPADVPAADRPGAATARWSTADDPAGTGWTPDQADPLRHRKATD